MELSNLAFMCVLSTFILLPYKFGRKAFLAIASFLFIFLLGIAFAFPSVEIVSPANSSTIFNVTICINATSNESISSWKYNLDSQGNQSFTPPTYINVSQGEHDLEIWAYNGSVWNYNTSDFTAAYIIAYTYEEDTNEKINTTVRILNSTSYIELTSAETENGEANLSGFEYGTYKVSFGKANSNYPYIRTYTFTFDEPNETLEGYLIKSGEGYPVTWQVVDGYYGNPIQGANVKFYKGGKILDEILTDSYGTVSEYMLLSTYYCIKATKSGYQDSDICYAPTQSSYAITMLKSELETIQLPSVTLVVEPKGDTLIAGRTYYFSFQITDSESKLTEYGIILGANPETIKDDSIPYDGVTKIFLVKGSNPSGGYIYSQGVDLHSWYGSKLYAGYYYMRQGEEKTWIVKEFKITGMGDPIFYPVKEALANIMYGFGFESELSLILLALFSTAFISGWLALRGGTLLGVIGMLTMLAFWVMTTILDKWTFVVALIVNGALAHYLGRLGGAEY